MSPSQNSSQLLIHGQRGNIFFYILLAVVLVAALSFAIASSLRGNSNVSNERNSLSAAEIVEAGSRLAEATARLRLRGIASTALSFENDLVTGYGHGGCLSDPCKIFSTKGGGLSWEEGSAANNNKPWGFSSSMEVPQVGTDEADLVAVLPEVTVETCSAINHLLSLTPANTPPPLAATFGPLVKFVGTYSVSPVPLSVSSFAGKKAGCLQATTASGNAITSSGSLTDKYFYYQVLVAQ
jgi:hypothetical protein